TMAGYQALIRESQRIEDSFYWLGHDEVGDLLSTIRAIRKQAEQILDEFDKVLALKRVAAKLLAEAEEVHRERVALRLTARSTIDDYVDGLEALRLHRGHLGVLRERPYIDLARIEAMDAEVEQREASLSEDTVRFLLG